VPFKAFYAAFIVFGCCHREGNVEKTFYFFLYLLQTDGKSVFFGG